MNLIVTHGVVALVSVTVGYAFHSFSNDEQLGLVNDAETASPTNRDTSALAAPEASVLAAPEATALAAPKESTDNDDLTITSNGSESTEDLLAVSAPSTTPSSIPELLTDAHPSMLETDEIMAVSDSFVNWFNESENPGQDILDFLLSDENSDDQKHVMEYLIASNSAMQTIDDLDLSIVRQLAVASQEDNEEWENILNIISISSSDARSELMNSLPNISNDQIVSASLLAIKPGFVSPAERSQLLNDISLYTESDSEEVRSAAVMSLGQWSAQGYSYIVEDMLTNGTIEQKNAAIISANSGNIWSEQIAHQTLSILNDVNIPDDIRNNAFFALSKQPLDDYSYEQVHDYYVEYLLPQEQNQ